MRNFLSMIIALAAFTATVAVVNSFGAASDAILNFDIQDAAERLALMIGEPLAAMAEDAELPLSGEGYLSTFIGAIGLSIPALFAFVLFGRS